MNPLTFADMNSWIKAQIGSGSKKPLPLLSFPSIQLMDTSVRELLASAQLQAEGVARVAERLDAAAAVSFMDLSVEAEAFGARIKQRGDEVPTVVGALVEDEDDVESLLVPEVGAARTGLCVEAVRIASSRISDRPLLAGVIGPYSLAGRLLDVSEAMIYCYEEPDMVHAVLRKAADFLKSYCDSFKRSGAQGVVIAEPLAGLLSPALAHEFSHPYVREIIEAVQDDCFAVFYHNCGDNVPLMADDIYQIGARAYHFGDAISLVDMLDKAPEDVLVLGNISPAALFRNGSPEAMREAVFELLDACAQYPNFMLSSGCDIPPMASWENIEAFFDASADYYAQRASSR